MNIKPYDKTIRDLLGSKRQFLIPRFQREYGNNSVCFSSGDITPNTFIYSSAGNPKPNNIFSLADAFLSIAPMTNKKLQKLCYYAKAWYLALYGHNLVNEPFEAWVHGAVQPALYYQYRKYGYSDIPQISDTTHIPEEYLSFAKEVYKSYGHLTGDELERINHQEAPWIEARGDCMQWEACSNVISERTMQEYYRKQLN